MLIFLLVKFFLLHLYQYTLATAAHYACQENFCSIQNELYEWLIFHGATISEKVEISTGPDPDWTIRGLFATRDIEAGEIIAALPANVRICGQTMCDLVYFLSEQLKFSNQSNPFIKAVSQHDIDSIPSAWTDDERSLLSNLYPTDWTRHITWFVEACNGDTNDSTQFRAALLVVAHSHEFESETRSSCMSPLYDLLNHDMVGYNTALEVIDGDVLIVKAVKNVPAGNQLFYGYGEQGVGRFLRDYGFVPKQHKWEFLDSKGRVNSFIVDKVGEEIWLDSNPDNQRHQSKDFETEFLIEVQIHLLELLDSQPLPNSSMKESRVNVALSYRQQYINALKILQKYLERKYLEPNVRI
jgi:hypothetical protein